MLRRRRRRFWVLFTMGWLVLMALLVLDLNHHPALGPFASAWAIALFVLATKYLVLEGWLQSDLPDRMSTSAMWRVAVTINVFCFGLPAVFVFLAASSTSRSAVMGLLSNTPHAGHWWAVPEELCLLGIPALLVVVPEYLHTQGRAAAASSRVPAWLAGFASVLTAAFILSLHYGGSAEAELRKASPGVLSVAAFGVATLLAPLYRFVVTQCVQQGIAVAFDPGRWWSAWCVVYGEMMGAPTVTAGAGDDARPDTVRALADGTGVPDGNRGTGGTGSHQESSS
jgi:hypothetical protein